jgi:dephospho-CoA kinase
MLSLGLTGGIAAGKSLLSARFRELGAVVIDADQLARDVVAVGTPGLAAVVDRFGGHLLLPDGSLDRPRLGSLVFGDRAALEALNAIVHPLVRAAANAARRAAGPDDIVVQDIPLLVESGQSAGFHLVVVVQAPREERIARMVRDRGMSREDALARMAAQASDEDRAAVADVLISNDGSPERALTELDTVWQERLLPYAANVLAGRPAERPAGETVAGPGAADVMGHQGLAARVMARIRHAAGALANSVDYLGATSPAGGGGVEELTFRLLPAPGGDRQRLQEALAGAGFFPSAGGVGAGNLLASADPTVPATVEIMGQTQ